MCDGIEYKGKLFMFKKNEFNIQEQWFIMKNFYKYIDKVFIKNLSKIWYNFVSVGCTFEQPIMKHITESDVNVFTNHLTKLSSSSKDS